MIINTAADMAATSLDAEKVAFLSSLLNDFTTFDDASYPADYDDSLKPGDDGYVAPEIRKEWNAVSAASWGFSSREQIEALLA